MPFIGVIADNKDAIQIKQKISNILGKNNIIIIITKNNISNIKNIKFDVLIVDNDTKILSNIDTFKNILSKTKYLVINADLNKNLDILDNLELTVITYGLNQKSTITASSINEEDVLICLQRSILTVSKVIKEPGEVKIKLSSKEFDNNVYNLMAVVSTLLIYNKLEIK